MKIKRYLILALLIIFCSAPVFSGETPGDPENKKKTEDEKKNTPVGLDDTPVVFALLQNTPNPFNPLTVIKYTLPEPAIYTFKVYDLIGNEVFSYNGADLKGTYEITFDGSNLSSGIYLYTLQTDKFSSTKKMILIK